MFRVGHVHERSALEPGASRARHDDVSGRPGRVDAKSTHAMADGHSPEPSPPALFKDVLRGSGAYSIPFVAERLVSTVLLPVTTGFLSPAQYGIANVLEQFGSIISLLLGGAYSSALGFFYSKAEPGRARHAVVSTTIFGALLLGLLAGALCLPLAGLMSQFEFGDRAARGYLYIIFIGLAPSFLLAALMSWLRVENRPGLFVAGALLRLGVSACSVVLLLVVYGLGLWGLLYSSLAAAVIPALALSAYFLYRVRPTFDVRLFGRMASFAGPTGLSGIAMFIMHFGDQFILPHYRSFTEVGIYSLSYKFGMLVSAVYSSFQTYWGAQCYQIMKRQDGPAVFSRLFTYMALGVSFVGLEVVLWSGPAIHLLTARTYWAATAFVPFVVVAYVLRSFGDFARVVFYVEGRPGLDAACTWISAAVCLSGYAILIPPFGAWGAIAATTATFVVYASLAIAWTSRLRPCRFDAARLAKISIAAVAVGVPAFLMPNVSVPAQIGLAIGLSAAFPALLWLMGFATPGEMAAVRSAMRHVSDRVMQRH